jgi:hypothetical protein
MHCICAASRFLAPLGAMPESLQQDWSNFDAPMSNKYGLENNPHYYFLLYRSMIISVREYTGKKVDVVAYSMGSPLARKVK